MTDATEEKQLKGWHVLLWFLAFFGLMFAVNGVFLFNAITSFPGEDIEKSYRQGVNYNQVLNARADMADLGWQAELGMIDRDVVFRLEDADAQAIYGRDVTGLLRRPATTSADTEITLNHRKVGEYRADLSGLKTGRWEATIRVMSADGERVEFEARKELRLR
ncbi:MAG: FixH family protein [Pseudomonadota bacterium]